MLSPRQAVFRTVRISLLPVLALGLPTAVQLDTAPVPPAARPAAPASAPIDLIWMTGPITAGRSRVPQPHDTPKLRARGAELYAEHCAACHGPDGDGKGPLAPALDYPPTDFTKGVYKVRSTASGTLPTDADLFATISRGMHGTRMFPWYRLPERDRWALVYRIKKFSPRFAHEPPGRVLPVPPPPVESEELVENGKRLYRILRCDTCHGAEGAGDGISAELYGQGREGKPVRVRDFRKGQFLRGRELIDVYRTLVTGLDGTPMGAYETLQPRDLWALAAYVRDLVRVLPVPEVPAGWDVAAPRGGR